MAEGGFDRLDRNGPVPQGAGVVFGGILQLRTCPYEPSHRVGAGSFSLHLNKCRNAAPEHIRKQFVVCEYNATHHMLETLYMDHLKICDDYREVKASRFQLPAEFNPASSRQVVQRQKTISKEEVEATTSSTDNELTEAVTDLVDDNKTFVSDVSLSDLSGTDSEDDNPRTDSSDDSPCSESEKSDIPKVVNDFDDMKIDSSDTLGDSNETCVDDTE